MKVQILMIFFHALLKIHSQVRNYYQQQLRNSRSHVVNVTALSDVSVDLICKVKLEDCGNFFAIEWYMQNVLQITKRFSLFPLQVPRARRQHDEPRERRQ